MLATDAPVVLSHSQGNHERYPLTKPFRFAPNSHSRNTVMANEMRVIFSVKLPYIFNYQYNYN